MAKHRALASSSSGNTRGSLKKKGQGLLCFVGNILVSRLKKQDQVLAGAEDRLEAEEVALVSGEQQPGCGCARWP